jgi:hypothetical protein
VTEKVQKKMSVAQGVGLKEPDYPCGSEESVSRSESAPQRDAAANDYPAPTPWLAELGGLMELFCPILWGNLHRNDLSEGRQLFFWLKPRARCPQA